jgi:hypothetical protein
VDSSERLQLPSDADALTAAAVDGDALTAAAVEQALERLATPVLAPVPGAITGDAARKKKKKKRGLYR